MIEKSLDGRISVLVPCQPMSYQSDESQVNRILKSIGLEGAPRDSKTMRLLAEVIEHPSQVADSVFIRDGDPLKISAFDILDQFEETTNGMREPEEFDSSPSEIDPFLPWRYLIDAVRAFYDNDIPGMQKALRCIPAGTAPYRLMDIFEVLAGKPKTVGRLENFPDRLLTKNQVLVNGIDVLEEAAAYPDLLRRETAGLLYELTKENSESARRLALWALQILAEDDVLTDADEAVASALGQSEAARLCALASLPYDPDRSLTTWVRSLDFRLLEGGTTPAEVTARLSIAAELIKITETEGRLSEELLSGAGAVLEASYPILKSLLPTLPPRSGLSSNLYGWLVAASKLPTHEVPVNLRTPRRRRHSINVGELTLFDEVTP